MKNIIKGIYSLDVKLAKVFGTLLEPIFTFTDSEYGDGKNDNNKFYRRILYCLIILLVLIILFRWKSNFTTKESSVAQEWAQLSIKENKDPKIGKINPNSEENISSFQKPIAESTNDEERYDLITKNTDLASSVAEESLQSLTKINEDSRTEKIIPNSEKGQYRLLWLDVEPDSTNDEEQFSSKAKSTDPIYSVAQESLQLSKENEDEKIRKINLHSEEDESSLYRLSIDSNAINNGRKPLNSINAPVIIKVSQTVNGLVTSSDGELEYLGSTIDNKPYGKGVLTCPNVYIYDGDFVDGKIIGKGVLTWSNREEKYEGEFVDGKITGKGTFTWWNGYTYEGEFVDGKITGKGVLIWPNREEKYEGEFLDNKITGRGIRISLSDGHGYDGYWLDGKRNGGEFILPGNNRFSDIFSDKENIDHWAINFKPVPHGFDLTCS